MQEFRTFQTIFAKVCTPNWSEEVFAISKIKNALPWTYVINDLNDEETKLFELFKTKKLI